VIQLPTGTKIWIAAGVTDMRRIRPDRRTRSMSPLAEVIVRKFGWFASESECSACDWACRSRRHERLNQLPLVYDGEAGMHKAQLSGKAQQCVSVAAQLPPAFMRQSALGQIGIKCRSVFNHHMDTLDCESACASC
jgi:hypothetical protein